MTSTRATAAALLAKTNQSNDGESMVVDGMIEFDVDAIREHVICSLCHGVYREPYTTIKCFHTFCKSCLLIALHATHFNPKTFNVCPAEGCLEYFGSHQVISKIAIPDRTLQTVIDKVLFPSLAQKDKEAEEAFYRNRGIEKKDTVKTTHDSANDINNVAQRITKVTFKLEPINNSPPLPRPVIEADGKIRVREIKKFISQQLDTTVPIQILCEDAPLGDELSVTFVMRSVWMETEGDIMTLWYHVFSN